MSSKYIYNDPIAKSMGLKPIQEYYPDYDFNPPVPEDSINIWGGGNEINFMYGRSVVTEQQLRWYTDGTKNIYVTEDTQPDGFRRGRSNMKRKPHSKETRTKISRANTGQTPPNRISVLSPDGLLFVSIKEAASHCGLTVSQFRHRMVKNGNWVYDSIS